MSDNTHLQKSNRQKIEALIFEELCRKRLLESEIDILEEQINSFVRTYCMDLEAIFRDIEYADRILEKHAAGEPIQEDDIEATNDNNASFSKNFFETDGGQFIKQQMDEENVHRANSREVNRLYRKLVKHCHPDIPSADPDSREVFDMVQVAYNGNDLKTLMMLERIIEEHQENHNPDMESQAGTLSESQALYANLKKENEHFQEKKQRLMQSSELNLKRRIEWAKMCGENPMVEIKATARKDRDTKWRELEKLGISANNEKKIVHD